jgi:sidestep protein, putative
MSISLGAKIRYESIKEGNDVYLECKAKANPPITAISWYFEEEGLMSDSGKGVIIANQSLVLQKVKRTQSGRYVCSASNTVGVGHSEDFFLKINCRCSSLSTPFDHYLSVLFFILLFYIQQLLQSVRLDKK